MGNTKKSIQFIDSKTIAKPDRTYWNTTAGDVSELKYMYSLGLYDMQTLRAIRVPEADPANEYKGREAPFFTFPTPPSDYEISEDAATTIIPTQNGGKFIESQGNIFKNIRIGGTVGLRPNPVSDTLFGAGGFGGTGVNVEIPSALAALTHDLRGLRPEENTGLDDITFLRNLFRGYWDLKKSNEMARRVVMVWMYRKESEWYIVEPLSFSTSRSAANPLSWNYSISLRTLFRFDQTLWKEEDSLTLKDILGFPNKIRKGIRSLARSLNQLAAAAEFFATLPFQVANKFLTDVVTLTTALKNISNTGQRFSQVTRGLCKNIENNANIITTSIRELGYGRSRGDNRVFGANQSSLAEPTDDAALDLHNHPLLNPTIKIARVAKELYSTDELFTVSSQIMVNDYAKGYRDEDGEKSYTAGSPFDPSNIRIPSAAREVDVMGNEDIRAMAKLYLGDESQWKTLVVINNLKPPYISHTSGTNILGPGDKMLIPRAADDEDITSVKEAINPDEAQQALSAMQQKYGRDLKISASSFGIDLADLQVNQRGDLDVIDGSDNIYQAMVIKFSTETGELATHPTFGAMYPIGTKVNINRIQEFALNTRRTALSDPRVDDIIGLRIRQQADILRVNAHIKIKDVDTTLPIDFSVRR